MQFRGIEIQEILLKRAGAACEQADEKVAGSDVVYALFLEPSAEAHPEWSGVECIIDRAVRLFQPSPALAHVELLVPPVPTEEGLRTQFATYLGRSSGWQTDKADGYSYYLAQNGNRWRAVPIFQLNASDKLRAECDMELGVGYSLARYASSVPPGRWLANWLPDRRRSPAHCATLTARVLKNAHVYAPKHSSAWYGPSTLYHELTHQAAWQGERMGASQWTGMPAHTAEHVEQLLRGVMDTATVQSVGDARCTDAVHALTMRACNALLCSDAVAQRTTQQQLATALLRWVLLRAPDGSAASHENGGE